MNKKVLIPTIVIITIVIVVLLEYTNNRELTVLKDDNRFGYQNKYGYIVIEPSYDEARTFHGEYAIIKKDGLYGVVNKSDKLELKIQYKTIQFLSNTLLYLVDKEYDKSIYSIETKKHFIKNIKELVQRTDKIISYKKNIKNRKFPSFEILYLPNNNVCNLDKYSHVESLNELQISYILKDKEKGVIDLRNCQKVNIKKIEPTHHKNKTKVFNGNITRTIYKEKELYGLMDENNRIILSPVYNELYFDAKYSLVYGFNVKKKIYSGEIFDLDGNRIINKFFKDIPSSEYQRSLENGTLGVQEISGKYGIIDIQGNIIQPFIYSTIFALKKYKNYITYIYDYKNNQHKGSLINDKGKTILNSYNNIYSYQNDLIKYKRNGYIGLIDRDGRKVIDTIYEDILIDGKNFIVKKNNKYGLINHIGTIIIPIKYNDLSFSNGGLYTFKDNKYWGYITEKGKEVFRIQSEYLSNMNTKGIGYLIINKTQYIVQRNKRGKYEIIK